MKIILNDEISLDSNYCFENIIEILRLEGWDAYLDDTEKLRIAFEKSLSIYEIRKCDVFVGFIRLLGDGIHTLLIQDILIIKNEIGKGIGSIVINKILEMYKNVRQKIVLCDDEKELNEFYIKLGFKIVNEYGIKCFGIF